MRELNAQEKLIIKRFTWNAKPTPDQLARMHSMREKGRELCEFMIRSVPASADRSEAIRDLRKAITQCNLAIAHEDMSKEDK